MELRAREASSCLDKLFILSFVVAEEEKRGNHKR
jgi:hypothetical protein